MPEAWVPRLNPQECREKSPGLRPAGQFSQLPGPSREEGGSRQLSWLLGLVGRWTGTFHPQAGRQVLGVKTAPGFKIRETRGLPLPSQLCDIGQVPNLAKPRSSHLSNGDNNYFPNLPADLGLGCSKPGAQGTTFKEMLALRC